MPQACFVLALVTFSGRVLQLCPGSTLDCDPPAYVFHIAGITGPSKRLFKELRKERSKPYNMFLCIEVFVVFLIVSHRIRAAAHLACGAMWLAQVRGEVCCFSWDK
jgi:hypothetical protein